MKLEWKFLNLLLTILSHKDLRVLQELRDKRVLCRHREEAAEGYTLRRTSYGFYQYYYSLMGYSENTNFLAAAGGSCTASLLTQPFSVLRKRIQSSSVEQKQRWGALGVLKGLWRNEGLRGFTKSFSIRLTEKSMSYAIVWGIYHKVKDWIDSV